MWALAEPEAGSLSAFRQKSLDELQLGLGLLVEVVVDLVDLGLLLLRDPPQHVVLQEPLFLLLEDPAIVLLLLPGSVLDLQELVPDRGDKFFL